MTFNIRNGIAILLIALSLLCLVPGLSKPILNIYIGTKLPFLGKVEVFNQTQSILQSVESLLESGNTFVAVLIFLFSVVVPVTKALILLGIISFQHMPYRSQLKRFLEIIGKWSMADVFVVAVFMAFLAAQANQNVTAQLHEGFYYFLAYCIISIISIQVVDIHDNVDMHTNHE